MTQNGFDAGGGNYGANTFNGVCLRDGVTCTDWYDCRYGAESAQPNTNSWNDYVITLRKAVGNQLFMMVYKNGNLMGGYMNWHRSYHMWGHPGVQSPMMNNVGEVIFGITKEAYGRVDDFARSAHGRDYGTTGLNARIKNFVVFDQAIGAIDDSHYCETRTNNFCTGYYDPDWKTTYLTTDPDIVSMRNKNLPAGVNIIAAAGLEAGPLNDWVGGSCLSTPPPPPSSPPPPPTTPPPAPPPPNPTLGPFRLLPNVFGGDREVVVYRNDRNDGRYTVTTDSVASPTIVDKVKTNQLYVEIDYPIPGERTMFVYALYPYRDGMGEYNKFYLDTWDIRACGQGTRVVMLGDHHLEYSPASFCEEFPTTTTTNALFTTPNGDGDRRCSSANQPNYFSAIGTDSVNTERTFSLAGSPYTLEGAKTCTGQDDLTFTVEYPAASPPPSPPPVAQCLDGYWPLYRDESVSNGMSPDGTSHTHTLGGVTWYMPDSFSDSIHAGTCPGHTATATAAAETTMTSTEITNIAVATTSTVSVARAPRRNNDVRANTFTQLRTVTESKQAEIQTLLTAASVTVSERRARRKNIVKVLLDSAPEATAMRLPVTTLALPNAVTASFVVATRAGKIVDMRETTSNEAVYVPLDAGEFIVVDIPNSLNLTFTRNDDYGDERYYVTAESWDPLSTTATSCSAGCANFNVSAFDDTSNYLVPDDIILVGGFRILIGSVTVEEDSGSGSAGDPHIAFAHGGKADFRGANDTYFSLLSVPGFQFAARTLDTSFLLPRPQLVHGSFFTDVAFRFRGRTGREYGVTSSASNVSFSVYDVNTKKHLETLVGVWKQWWEDGVRVYYKQSTIYVRAHGWEVNATRHPVYNYVSGPSRWRYDFSIRYLDGTAFEKFHGRSSASCYPHGVIGQSWDGDTIGVNGRVDDYTYNVSYPVIVTSANAEGSIEGVAHDYALSHAFDVDTFRYGRYRKNATSICPPRDVRLLRGSRFRGEHIPSVAHTSDDAR